MTIWIVRVGNSLMIEISDKIAEQAGLEEGQAVKWVVNDRHSLALVKPRRSPKSGHRLSLQNRP
jgi:antitoxin component of MazEF toxin-antitoxin module